MNGAVVDVRVGAQLLFDGDLVQVVELDGIGVTVRNGRTGHFQALTLGRLVAGCTAVDPPEETLCAGSVGTTLAGLTKAQREQVAERAEHVRQLLAADGSRLQDRLEAKSFRK